MKSFISAFALVTLLALIPWTQCMAQTPPAPANVADFLNTLSSDQSSAPSAGDQMPSPKFLTTYCTSSAECPTGQLCCYPCGIDGCSNICMQPVNKRCPLFV